MGREFFDNDWEAIVSSMHKRAIRRAIKAGNRDADQILASLKKGRASITDDSLLMALRQAIGFYLRLDPDLLDE